MIQHMWIRSCRFYEDLSRRMAETVLVPWTLCVQQCKLEMEEVAASLARSLDLHQEAIDRKATKMKPVQEVDDLTEEANDRVKRGLAPPRGIYDVSNRNRIDWNLLPMWARPSDPELFGDSPHEG